MTVLLYIIIICALAIAGYFLYKTFRQASGGKTDPYNKTLLEISVPKENEKTPVAAESMFASLHGLYEEAQTISGEQERVSFEIVADSDSIKFYVYASERIKDFVSGQIYAQYPNALINETSDYARTLEKRIEKNKDKLPKNISLASTELKLTKDDYFPIKTFLNFDVDPLAGITGVVSKLGAGEQTWIQIIVEPVSDAWQENGIAYAEAIRAGKNPKKGFLGILRTAALSFLADLLKTAMNPEAEAGVRGEEDVKLPGPVEAALTGIDEKVVKLGFATKIRVLTLGKTYREAVSRLSSIVSAFKQFNTQNMNGFVTGDVLSDDLWFLDEYTDRSFDEGFILNIEELASLYHLPNISVETPNIVWAGAKKGEPPANLPLENNTDQKELTILGKTDFRGEVIPFGMRTDDRRRHVYVIGKTGTGKTTLLNNMAISDIRSGEGVCVVDPHGDFVSNLLDFIPRDRINDVIIFDPSDIDYPVAFNLLENVDPSLQSVVASGLIGIFKKIWADSWGPRLEHILRNTIMALLDYPNSTMIDIMRMLVDQNFRRKVIEKIKDPVVKEFWITEFEQYDQRFRTEAIAPIQNKVGQFLSSATIRNILGQPKSTIDVQDAMDSGKILLVNLSKGKIGEDNSALLGAMIITKIQITSLQRAYIPEEERKDFYLYVDEFQNFATESFGVILSEARKYKLSIIMANQYISQMEEPVRESVFGNVGTIISFRVGPSDAPYLAKEYMPIFEETDLINLDKFHIYVKMSVDGVTTPPFSSITLPPFTDKNENKEEAIKISRERYGKSRESVEKKIEAESTVSTTISSREPFESSGGEKIKGLQQISDSAGGNWYIVPEGGEVPEEVDELEKKFEKNKDKENPAESPPAGGHSGGPATMSRSNGTLGRGDRIKPPPVRVRDKEIKRDEIKRNNNNVRHKRDGQPDKQNKNRPIQQIYRDKLVDKSAKNTPEPSKINFKPLREGKPVNLRERNKDSN